MFVVRVLLFYTTSIKQKITSALTKIRTRK